MSHQRVAPVDWAVYVLLAVIWGSSFILIKTGLQYFSPVVLAALRVTIAGLVLLPLAYNGLRALSYREQLYAVLMGLCGSAVPAFLFATAQTRVESGIAGILNSLTPIFILVTGLVFFNVRYTWQQTLGVVVGFIGCAGLILLSHQPHGTYDNHFAYALLIVVATVLYGLSNQILMRFLSNRSTLHITPVAFFYAGIGTALILLTTDFGAAMQQPGAWNGLGYVALLAACGSAFALLLYNRLAQRTGVAFAGTVTYVMPVISIMWSYADNEFIGWQHFGAMALILLGVFLVRKRNAPVVVTTSEKL